MTATYITTTIPYVNARPHIGHAGHDRRLEIPKRLQFLPLGERRRLG